MKVLCYCSTWEIDPEHSTYVKNSKPVCRNGDCEEAFLSIERQLKEEDNATNSIKASGRVPRLR